MNKFLPVLVAGWMFATAAYADAFHSVFGFSMDVPRDWLVLSQQQLEQGAGSLNSDDPKFIGMDKAVMLQLLAKVKSGNMEVYLHKGFGAGGFTNNINVIHQASRIPADDVQLKQTCDQLPAVFVKFFGHTGTVYQCSLTMLAGKRAMLAEFDGALPGTRSIQYQIEAAEGEVVMVTGTFTNGTLEKERPVFAGMMSSMKFQ